MRLKITFSLMAWSFLLLTSFIRSSSLPSFVPFLPPYLSQDADAVRKEVASLFNPPTFDVEGLEVFPTFYRHPSTKRVVYSLLQLPPKVHSCLLFFFLVSLIFLPLMIGTFLDCYRYVSGKGRREQSANWRLSEAIGSIQSAAIHCTFTLSLSSSHSFIHSQMPFTMNQFESQPAHVSNVLFEFFLRSFSHPKDRLRKRFGESLPSINQRIPSLTMSF